ncbi:hypothetical protein SpiGrapes_2397 [Sphaerochaeta pleomorpha str. Grapes]|uniref:Uncharacterized protein n=1 Tax=Sphaerochaeta pleomorpha (strain ATCC BAA-1885 / DSM 22778 / Grapes) TaxID=158190 RepID=G8QSY6_SPHPG|nr:hypothetical protein SpiGrapes_2397 [Sphaerochaeta pleomorpha str. Grapes]
MVSQLYPEEVALLLESKPLGENELSEGQRQQESNPVSLEAFVSKNDHWTLKNRIGVSKV